MAGKDIRDELLEDPEVRRFYEDPPFEVRLAFAVVRARQARKWSPVRLAKELGVAPEEIAALESFRGPLADPAKQKCLVLILGLPGMYEPVEHSDGQEPS